MLEIESYVPNVYVKKSRDFQMYCKVLEIVSNSAKFNADTITDIYNPLICNNRVLSLLSTICNYNPKRDISDDDLRLILTSYPALIKNKGTQKGIELAAALTVKLSGKPITYHCDYIAGIADSSNDTYKVRVTMSDTYDERYLQEFMDLVMPVGFMLEAGVSGYNQENTQVGVQIERERVSKSNTVTSSVQDESSSTFDSGDTLIGVEVLSVGDENE